LGRVRYAVDLERGRPVAVKILPLAAAELRHDAKREVQSLALSLSLLSETPACTHQLGAQVAVMKRLRHANVVRLLQV
jgi:serine/threonine protein kinase